MDVYHLRDFDRFREEFMELFGCYDRSPLLLDSVFKHRIVIPIDWRGFLKLVASGGKCDKVRCSLERGVWEVFKVVYDASERLKQYACFGLEIYLRFGDFFL